MRLSASICLPTLVTSLLLGCGPSVLTPTPAQPQYPRLQGNWQITVDLSGPDLQAYEGPLLDLRGALQSSGSEVNGTLHAIAGGNPFPCLLITEDLAVKGTVDTSGKLSLTVPMADGLATFDATLSSDLHQYAHGSWQVSGGPCATPLTPARAAEIASTTGTYAGTFSATDLKSGAPIAGSETPVSITLSQSDLPDTHGTFPLTGVIHASGTLCSGVYPFDHGVVFGNGVFDRALPNATSFNPRGLFNGSVDPATATLTGTFTFSPGCATAGLMTGMLVRR